MPPAYNYSSVAIETQLSGPVGLSDTTINVDATTGFPAAPFNLTIDPNGNEEIVTVTAVVGLSLTVLRGQDGTLALNHLAGKKVRHQAIGRDLQLARDHEAATSGVHGVAVDDTVLGRKQVATLENKTIDGTQNTITNVAQSAVSNLIVDQDAQDAAIVANAVAIASNETDIANLDTRLTTAEDEIDDLQAVPAPTITRYTSPTGATFNWNKPAGLKGIWVRVQAPGGGGGGALGGSGQAMAGSGGAGGYAEKFIPADSLGSSETVTIGGPGSPGAAGNNNGGNGGTTSFGSHLSATGGTGGSGSGNTTGNASSNGGVGGVGSGGDVNMRGGDGSNGVVRGGTRVNEGGGGNAVLGGGGQVSSGTGTGASGGEYGGGGSGSSASGTSFPGAAGGHAVVIVLHVY